MRLAHVGLHNFASHKNTEIDFPEDEKLVLIRGLNGTGKSFLMDGVSFAPYGKVMRSGEMVTPKRLVRDFQDTGHAEIILQGEREMRIERRMGKKSSNVRWWMDGVEGKGRTNRQKQPLIEKQLGFSYESFMSASYLSQGRVGVFTDGKSADRVKILTNVLDLASVDEAVKTAKRQVTVLTDRAELICGKIEFLEAESEKIGSAESIVETIQYMKDKKRIEERELGRLRKLRDAISDREEMQRSYRENIASLRSIVASRRQAIARLAREMAHDSEERLAVTNKLKPLRRAAKRVDRLKELLKEHPYPQEEVDEQIDAQAEVTGLIFAVENQIERFKHVMKKGGDCPTCGRSVEAGHSEIEILIKALEAERRDLAKQKRRLDVQNKDLQARVEQHTEISVKLGNTKRQIEQKTFLDDQDEMFAKRIFNKGVQKRDDEGELTGALLRIKRAKANYKKAMAKFSHLDESLDASDLNESIEAIRSKLGAMALSIEFNQKNLARSKQIREEISSFKAQRKAASGSTYYYEYWVDRFPKVKLGLIDTFIPQMEAISNTILSSFTPIRVEFPTSKERQKGGRMDSFRIVVYKGKVVREWGNWSGGEKKQVAIAICLAMNTALWNMGFGLDFILMDEVFSDLDVEKRPKVLKYLVESGRNVFVISHTDINPAFFDRVITVTMKNDISRING